MKMDLVRLALGLSVVAGTVGHAAAQSASSGTREVPSRVLPVPDTVSPQMQALIARPLSAVPGFKPETSADWKEMVDKAATSLIATLPKLRETLGVTVEPATIAGVKAFIVAPKAIRPGNLDRVLIHLHGGIRVFNPGEAGTRRPY